MIKKNILIAEDDSIASLSLSNILTYEGFNVIGIAKTAQDAVLYAQKHKPDLILMDIGLKSNAQYINGIDAAIAINDLNDIPIIFITGYDTKDISQQLSGIKAYGYMVKPINSNELITTVNMALQKHISEMEIKNTQKSLVKVIANTVEAKDPYTSGHQKNVAEIALMIAREMGLNKYCLQSIDVAGQIHDIGKLGIPAEILAKPIVLSPIEMELVRQHVEIGYNILKPIEFPWPIADIVYQHHERIDGSGYPQQLKGNNILIQAQIIGLADSFEAMCAHRPYRPALHIDAILDIISNTFYKEFDKEMCNILVSLYSCGLLDKYIDRG